MRHWWERVGYGVMGLAIALIFAACNPNNRSDDSSNADPTTSLPALKPFPEVAVLVRRGEPLEALKDPGSLDNLASIGFAPFATSLAGKYLSVQVKPELASLKPAETETLSLTLKDEKNNPVSGQFTVMVVNEAVLRLSGYRPPDLVETVYAEQPISLRFADNRQDVTLSPLSSPLEKGWGYGGGFSNAAASTRLREDFQALAFYNGSVIADDSGQATVSFELPDDLTTWRAMVVATDGNLRFGQGDATFVATQPLITNPLLPQFLRVGDRLQAGLTVTNTTGKGGKLQLEGQAGEGLEFADAGDRRTQQNQPDAGTAAYRFTMVAEQPGTAQIEFSSLLGAETDAFSYRKPSTRQGARLQSICRSSGSG
ncbi:alpha-2-macroglobulin family protein [Leptolyngbya sp. BC1307]|uniref:alpha-2-macroglobulin family protein n=1 Tax=Leptolyngbya sp. BC1307 TaxID=2029589 RepID=UPI001F0A908A|nr:alpha-2-macroglobulin family protein [Leptolyngbya sp. BC1307]